MLSRSQAILKLDFDTAKEPDLGVLVQRLARAGYIPIDTVLRRSPSGKGWHVLMEVEPRPRTAMEVVALQAVLGSDPWREAMQIARANAFNRCPAFMRDAWNVLYQSDRRRSRRITLGKLNGRRNAV